VALPDDQAWPGGGNETGGPAVFTDRGYAHVVVSRRGPGE